MINYIILIIIFFIGILFGSLFNLIGHKLPNIKNKSFKYTNCRNCNNELKFKDISLVSYILNKGKCKKCGSKISFVPVLFEFLTGILFVLCYTNFQNNSPKILILMFAFLFVSSLIIIMISDINYMIIPDEILLIFGIILAIIKLSIGFYNDEYKSILDVGYAIIFMFYEGFFMFLMMYLIKQLGDFLFQKDSMGGGDIKMMFYISMFMGWKLSIIIVFLASFIALPISIIKMMKKNQTMLAFGPYLAIATLIIFLSKIDINTILEILM